METRASGRHASRPEPTLPQKAQEGWGNPCKAVIEERLGQPRGENSSEKVVAAARAGRGIPPCRKLRDKGGATCVVLRFGPGACS